MTIVEPSGIARSARTTLLLWFSLLLANALCTTASANPDLISLQETAANWVLQNGNYQGTRYSALSQIDTTNVGRLQVAFTESTGVLRGHGGGPLIVDGILYIGTPFPNIVYAFDLNPPGGTLWQYEPRQNPDVILVMCCDTYTMGLAYAEGTIFLYQADTTLVALDAKSGAEVWKATNGDPKRGETATTAPIVVKNNVIVSIDGDWFGVRGHLTAYDIHSGRRKWRAYSTGPDKETLLDPARTTHLGQAVGPDSGLATWQDDQWKNGGGAPWGWIAYDASLNLIYYGTGNPGPLNSNQRPGDNRWTSSIFARNPDTGIARWVYQTTPHDQWNYGAHADPILLDFKEGERIRKALIQLNKNGFAYVLDRADGRLLKADKYLPELNWASTVDLTSGRPQIVPEKAPNAQGPDVNVENICPSAMGGKERGPSAYSPDTGLLYASTINLCMDIEQYGVSYTPGQPFVGANISMYPPAGSDFMGGLLAWDPVAGSRRWLVRERFGLDGGPLVTAGGIVFYGTTDGFFKAVDAQTGEELYEQRLPSGAIGNVATYMHGGKQYVALLAGIGGWLGIGLAAGLTEDTAGMGAVKPNRGLAQYTRLGGVLVVFELGPDPLATLKDAVRWIADRPVLGVAVVGGFVWFPCWIAIYFAFPLTFFEAARRLEPFRVPLPKWLGGGVDVPGHWLILGWLWRRPRVLDAWVRSHAVAARRNFASKPTISFRSTFISVPMRIDGRLLDRVEPSAFRRIAISGPNVVLIWGEGGSGKTSLACQIGTWCLAEEPTSRYFPHLALPVFIERELDKGDNGVAADFFQIVRSDLGMLIQKRVPEDVLSELLTKRRVIVLIDHYSELSDASRASLRPGMVGDWMAMTIVTSRIKEKLDDVPHVSVEPLRVGGDFLFDFMSEYLRERGYREAFSDVEFATACGRLAELVGTRETTVGLVTLFAEQLIASKAGPELRALPRNIPGLILRYVNDRNDSIPAEVRLRDSVVHRDGKLAAWVCVRSTYRMGPAWIEKELGPELEQADPNNVWDRIDYLAKRVGLFDIVDPSRDQIVFRIDPIGEYLAAMWLVEYYSTDEEEWEKFFEEANEKEGAPERIRGFLLAVRDCTVAQASGRGTGRLAPPGFVKDRIERWLGLDAEEEERLLLMHRMQHLIAGLSPVRPVEERRRSMSGLIELGMCDGSMVVAVVDALQDPDPEIVDLAVNALSRLDLDPRLADAAVGRIEIDGVLDDVTIERARSALARKA